MRRLLVVDFDGVALQGAVADVDRRGTVGILRHARSTAATPEAALDEVVGALGRTPSACVVRSAEVVAGLVRLPIASARGRTPDEIAQMLRWELEPLHAQQSAVRTVGDILEARGHLEHAQVERILATLRERRAKGDRDAASLRFGGIARELGLATDAQIAEALAIEERLGRTEEDHVCGWAFQPGAAGPGGGSLWLAVGVPAARRRWWAEQLATRRLRLLELLPRLPGAVAALDRRASATVVEVEPHAVARSVVRNGALVSLEIVPASEGEPADRIGRELLEGADPSGTFVSGSLADAWGRTRFRLLPTPLRGDAGGSPSAWAGIVGAARHAAGLGGPCAGVPARARAPSLLRRPRVRWAAAVLLVASLAAAADRLTARSLALSVQELAGARERLREVTSGIRDVERTGADAEEIAKEIASLEEERDALRARRAMLEDEVAARTRLLPRLLDALAASADDEILLDRTVEEGPGRIRVEGRALSERAVQAFGRAVAARVLPLRLRVADQAIRSGSSRLPGGPYFFSLLLDPLPEGDA